MFLFRAVFIIGFVSIAFVAQVSAIIFPLSRYMLDVIPEQSGPDADPIPIVSMDAFGTAVANSDLPAATGTSPVINTHDAAAIASVDSSAISPDATPIPPSVSKSRISQANSASPVGALGGTGVLAGSVLIGVLFAA